ncbi:MAG: gluconate 2-dehydrogenase subunit 3 family protein [Deltaproteobacteria bacterium]|nr:gluconate 2-dehydrogenase subunit 3 family protein [Deltaproteobacteria bacterium]
MSESRREPLLSGHPISRRGFLVRSVWVTAGLGAGALACGRGDARYAALLPAGETPSQIPACEYAVLRAVVDRLVPEATDRPGAIALGVPARIDRELAYHGPRLRDDVIAALRLVEWWPLVTQGSRFTALEPAAQDAVLEAMAASRLAARRTAMQGLKLLTVFFTYTQEPTWAAIGYDGPWVPRNRPAALG